MTGAPRPLDGWLDRGVKVAFIAAACALVYAAVLREQPTVTGVAEETGRTGGGGRPEPPPLPTEPVSLAGMRLRGDESARVILLEYGDYQCGFCARFAQETQPLIEEKYVRTGKVRLGYLHLPLRSHELAPKAAEAAECAGEQGKFWEMHERLFTLPPRLTEPDLIGHARDLELEMAPFAACLAGQMADKVRANSALAMQHGVTATPTFFIGQLRSDGKVRLLQRLPGAQPAPAFEALLDKFVAAAEADRGQAQ